MKCWSLMRVTVKFDRMTILTFCSFGMFKDGPNSLQACSFSLHISFFPYPPHPSPLSQHSAASTRLRKKPPLLVFARHWRRRARPCDFSMHFMYSRSCQSAPGQHIGCSSDAGRDLAILRLLNCIEGGRQAHKASTFICWPWQCARAHPSS